MHQRNHVTSHVALIAEEVINLATLELSTIQLTDITANIIDMANRGSILASLKQSNTATITTRVFVAKEHVDSKGFAKSFH